MRYTPLLGVFTLLLAVSWPLVTFAEEAPTEVQPETEIPKDAYTQYRLARINGDEKTANQELAKMLEQDDAPLRVFISDGEIEIYNFHGSWDDLIEAFSDAGWSGDQQEIEDLGGGQFIAPATFRDNRHVNYNLDYWEPRRPCQGAQCGCCPEPPPPPFKLPLEAQELKEVLSEPQLIRMMQTLGYEWKFAHGYRDGVPMFCWKDMIREAKAEEFRREHPNGYRGCDGPQSTDYRRWSYENCVYRCEIVARWAESVVSLVSNRLPPIRAMAAALSLLLMVENSKSLCEECCEWRTKNHTIIPELHCLSYILLTPLEYSGKYWEKIGGIDCRRYLPEVMIVP